MPCDPLSYPSVHPPTTARAIARATSGYTKESSIDLDDNAAAYNVLATGMLGRDFVFRTGPEGGADAASDRHLPTHSPPSADLHTRLQSSVSLLACHTYIGHNYIGHNCLHNRPSACSPDAVFG